MNYRTTFTKWKEDKHLDKPKKILFKSLEKMKDDHIILDEADKVDIKAFRDEDELYMYLNEVTIKFIPYSYMGKAFDIDVLGEKTIKIKKDGVFGYEEFDLWVIDRVLNFMDDPEYFI